jgi:hypothetical protein
MKGKENIGGDEFCEWEQQDVNRMYEAQAKGTPE